MSFYNAFLYVFNSLFPLDILVSNYTQQLVYKLFITFHYLILSNTIISFTTYPCTVR